MIYINKWFYEQSVRDIFEGITNRQVQNLFKLNNASNHILNFNLKSPLQTQLTSKPSFRNSICIT